MSEQEQTKKWYVVGLKPDSSADPEYWLDRFESIEATSAEEAVEAWIIERTGWLKPEEQKYIRIWDVLEEDLVGFDWRKKYAAMSMADAMQPDRSVRRPEVRTRLTVVLEEDLSASEATALLDEFEESVGKKSYSLDYAEWEHE